MNDPTDPPDPSQRVIAQMAPCKRKRYCISASS